MEIRSSVFGLRRLACHCVTRTSPNPDPDVPAKRELIKRPLSPPTRTRPPVARAARNDDGVENYQHRDRLAYSAVQIGRLITVGDELGVGADAGSTVVSSTSFAGAPNAPARFRALARP